MTLQLTLPEDMEKRLEQEAERRGLPGAIVALQLLDQHLPPPLDARRAAALSLLEQWRVEDESLSKEEEASNAQVLRCLDEDRPSYRKLFVDVLKDQST
ncbi:MAG TPA: hypothetical protein VE988_06730 [Gemmataceae bacterium]|nr:hypothetical protein [Gemmataceae bacterium]